MLVCIIMYMYICCIYGDGRSTQESTFRDVITCHTRSIPPVPMGVPPMIGRLMSKFQA